MSGHQELFGALDMLAQLDQQNRQVNDYNASLFEAAINRPPWMN